MPNNPFRRSRDNAEALGEFMGFDGGPIATSAAPITPTLVAAQGSAPEGDVVITSSTGASSTVAHHNGHTSKFDSVSEDHTQWFQHVDPFHPNVQPLYQKNQLSSQTSKNNFAAKSVNGLSSPPSSPAAHYGHEYPEANTRVHLSAQAPEVGEQPPSLSSLPEVSPHHQLSDRTLPEALTPYSYISATQRNGSHVDSLPEAVQSLQIQHQAAEVVTNSRHAHIPSFSQVRKESLLDLQPTYVRALSSQIPESIAPRMTPGEAHAEVLRRLDKAERRPKTLKRRGSNESLSSLISYSIRRPSVSARSESGHSLNTLATVLEDAAQEGNLPLVEAVMALGANPNFRSVNRLKNRRHGALNKAVAAGHVDVIDYLLKQGATFGSDEPSKKDPFMPIDYKLLDVAYAGYGEVAQYLITAQGANPFIQQWPRQYHDANRTVYRRVLPAKVYQRTVLDAIAKMGNAEEDMGLLNVIMDNPAFDTAAISARVYEDLPYLGDGSRMIQTIYHYSVLSSFIKAGWADAVDTILSRKNDPSAYQLEGSTTHEEGQIPSTNTQCYIYPANALTKDTWLYRRQDALRIVRSLIKGGFDLSFAQRTADDSAARTVLSRAILANAAEGVEMILQAQPALVKEEISFRLLLAGGSEQEYKAQPLAAAIVLGSLETARVILRNGARPYDPAFAYPNVLQFAAGHGGATATAILGDMIEIAPDLTSEAIESAIQKVKPDALHVLLYAPTARNMPSLRLYDTVLGCKSTTKDDEVHRKYLQMIDLIFGSDPHQQLPRPGSSAIQSSMENDNYIGVEKLLSLEVIDYRTLNERAYQYQSGGSAAMYTALGWCQAAGKGVNWINLLRSHGAQ